MPYVPTLPAANSMSIRIKELLSTKLGTVYKQMPDSATIKIAVVDKKPAFTAVSPKPNAATTDSAVPTYLGMRTLASVITSSANRVKNISMLGESGKP